MNFKTNYFSFTDDTDTVTAQIPNPAVSVDLLKEIHLWIEESCSFTDIIEKLRQRTVPSGYDYHPWITGECSSILKPHVNVVGLQLSLRNYFPELE